MFFCFFFNYSEMKSQITQYHKIASKAYSLKKLLRLKISHLKCYNINIHFLFTIAIIINITIMYHMKY